MEMQGTELRWGERRNGYIYKLKLRNENDG